MRCAYVMMALFLFVLIFSSTAKAEQGPKDSYLLNLSIPHYPRIYSLDVQFTYDAEYDVANGYGLITASGLSWEYYHDPSMSYYELQGNFELTAVIDKATLLPVSGTLYVDNDVEFAGETGYPVRELYNSITLDSFGFGGDDIFEFQFTQNGNDSLPPNGEPIGVIISAISVDDAIMDQFIDPDFQSDFANNGNGKTDTFYLPEPGSLVLLALGGLGVLRRRRSQV